MENSGAQEKTEPKKRLTFGERLLVEESFVSTAHMAADKRFDSMDTKKVSKDHKSSLRYSVTLLEQFVSHSPSSLGLSDWQMVEYATELVILKRVLEHLTAKPKS